MARGPGPAQRARSGGLTLVELLIVLVIIALVAAVAWPNVAGAWREGSFRASMGLVESALSNARMDAVRRGEALSAEVEMDGRGGAVLRVSALEPVGGAEAAEGEAGLLPGALATGVRGGAGMEEEAWRRVTRLSLPAGYRIVDASSIEDASGVGAGEEEARAGQAWSDAGGAEPGEPLHLAAFFPDGSALSIGRLALVDARGRRAWIEVGAVSGRVRLVRDDLPAHGLAGRDEGGLSGAGPGARVRGEGEGEDAEAGTP